MHIYGYGDEGGRGKVMLDCLILSEDDDCRVPVVNTAEGCPSL